MPGSTDGGSVAAVLPWLGAGRTGGVVCGVVTPAPKRIWLFGQSNGQLKQAPRVITSSSSPHGVNTEVTSRRSPAAPEPVEPYTRWVASDYGGTRGCPVQRFWPWRHRSTCRPRSAGECMELRWRRPAKTCRASGMPSQRQGDEVIGRGLVTVMASSSANVEAPPTAGVQVTEGPLAAEVPAGVFFPHPG